MSHLQVWLCLSIGAFIKWAVFDRFALESRNYFTGAVWWCGLALLLHFVSQKEKGGTP